MKFKKIKKLIALMLSVSLVMSADISAFAEESQIEVVAEENEEYTLSAEQRNLKERLNTYANVDEFNELVAGEDYANQIVTMYADDYSYVEYAAAKYNAEIIEYSKKVATLRLRDMSVSQALQLAADPANDYPAVDPNYIYEADYGIVSEKAANDAFSSWSEKDLDSTYKYDLSSWIDYLNENPDTEPDPYISYPARRGYQWHLAAVDAYAAWGVTRGIPDCKVAIIDSGIDVTNPDIRSNVTTDYSIVGASAPYLISHGTNVAGIVGAIQGNGLYGSGIAPDVTLMGYRVDNDEGAIQQDALVRCINDAVDKGAWVINLSLSAEYSNTLYEALKNAKNNDVCTFCAMGNYNSNIKVAPVGYEDLVIGVLASDMNGKLASFSSFGEWADVMAPGVSIYSTMPTLIKDAPDSFCENFDAMSGTSQASPLAAGICALYLSAVGHKVNVDTMSKLMKKSSVNGIVNAARLLEIPTKAPGIEIYKNSNAGEVPLTGNGLNLTEEAVIKMTPSDSNTKGFLLTVDGSKPMMSDGVVVNGYNFHTDAQVTISLAEIESRYNFYFDEGTTYTLKCAAVGGKGGLSPVTTVKFKMVEGEDTVAAPNEGVSKVKTIDSLSTNAIKLHAYADGKNETLQLSPVFRDASKNVIDASKVKYKFTSNKKSVAYVSPMGLIKAVSPGTATITCKALDGSRTKQKIKVKVLPGADRIDLSGQMSIAPGKKAKYKAVVYNDITTKKAKTEYIEYSLVGSALDGIAIDKKKGTVTVSDTAAIGTSFLIKAETSDGFRKGIFATKAVTVKLDAISVSINLIEGYHTAYADYDPVKASYDKKGKLRDFTLFSVKLPGKKSWDEINTNQIQLLGIVDEKAAKVEWKSSNPAIATVSANGVVTAHKAGKVKLTCITKDGAKKKASTTLNVLNPVSTMKVVIEDNFISSNFDYSYLALGCTKKLELGFGTEYGSPTNQNVEWETKIYTYDSVNKKYNLDDNTIKEINDKKYVTISKDGKVTLDARAGELIKQRDIINIVAKTTDGTNISHGIDFYVYEKVAKKLLVQTKKGLENKATAKLKVGGKGVTNIQIYSDVIKDGSNTKALFKVISSDPEVACALMNPSTGMLDIHPGTKAGKAVLTLYAVDGGKATMKIVVTVEE